MTKWFSYLHLVVLHPFLVSCVFCFLSKKPKQPDTTKNQKQICRKKRTNKKNQLAQLCSQIVFLNFWGGLKNQLFAESTIKIVVSTSFVKGKMAPKCQKC